METTPKKQSQTSAEWTARKPYTKPEVKRVDLALAETLSQGCKLGSDPYCVGPIEQVFLEGS